MVVIIPRLLKALGTQPRSGLGRTIGCKHGSVYMGPFQPAHMGQISPLLPTDHKATWSISKATSEAGNILSLGRTFKVNSLFS